MSLTDPTSWCIIAFSNSSSNNSRQDIKINKYIIRLSDDAHMKNQQDQHIKAETTPTTSAANVNRRKNRKGRNKISINE